MQQLDNFLVGESATIRDVIAQLDINGQHICLMVDQEKKLLGTITDGDVRRAVLAGVRIEQPAKAILNDTPHVVFAGTDEQQVLEKLREFKVSHLPVVDQEKRVVRLASLFNLQADDDEYLEATENWVLLMAGGLGERLRPLTNNRPKPLLEIGDKPLLQGIVERLVDKGFRKLFISVNFLGDMIVDHFGDGSKFGAEIQYIRETDRLGTAGALGLMPVRPVAPMIVMNADLITDIDFSALLAYHRERDGIATMAVRQYDFQVPYGVIDTVRQSVTNINEKPLVSFFVNAGIYVLEPEVIGMVPKGQHIDMTDLISRAIKEGNDVSAFPLIERWIDIGQLDDYERAKADSAH